MYREISLIWETPVISFWSAKGIHFFIRTNKISVSLSGIIIIIIIGFGLWLFFLFFFIYIDLAVFSAQTSGIIVILINFFSVPCYM